MKISAVQNNNFTYRQSFRSSSSKSVDELIVSPQIPQKYKKTLWELSEIPYFCQAAKDTPKGDLLRISKLILGAETNILKMALEGNVCTIVDKNGEPDINPLLSLEKIAETNAQMPKAKRRSLLDIIKASPILRIEQDEKREYPKENAYPKFLLYHTDSKDSSIKSQAYERFSLENVFANVLLNHMPIKDGQTVIMFQKPVVGKKDKHFHYYPTPTEISEEPMSVVPHNLSVIYQAKGVPEEYKKALFNLSEVPYFNNLIKNTDPVRVCSFASIDNESDNLFKKMLSGQLNFEIYNPKTFKNEKFPIIDPKRLLADRKYDIYSERDIIDILRTQTLALEVYKVYMAIKTVSKNESVQRLVFSCDDKDVTQIGYTSNGDDTNKWRLVLDENQKEAKKLKKFLDNLPYKTAIINFEKK